MAPMPIEHVAARAVAKPWGVADPRPWSQPINNGMIVGELWYERAGGARALPSLLLKLLFTSQPLSIQVHPDDAFARSIGLPNGKTEAWYVVEAAADAKIALGLRRPLSPPQLRQSIEDSSIAGLVVWHSVAVGNVILVPGGTVHAIGAGLVIAEIQQRSDTTYRLFDHGRQRDLHIDCAVAAAKTGVAEFKIRPKRLSHQRALLVYDPHFVLERLDLPPDTSWRMEAARETWLLALSGAATIRSGEITAGNAIFATFDQVDVHVGGTPLTCLVAYVGEVAQDLLHPLAPPHSDEPNMPGRILAPAVASCAPQRHKTRQRRKNE
jgi:mannose-6-phosphate isomerase